MAVTRQAVPLIRQLHARGDAIKTAELDRARRMLAKGDDADTVLEALAHALTSKFLHGPTTLLQRGGDSAAQLTYPLVSGLGLAGVAWACAGVSVLMLAGAFWLGGAFGRQETRAPG